MELEGHGRTVDLDRPLTYEQMAGDVAGLLDQLGLGRADIFGYSMGGITSLRLASRYPHLVRKLVVVSAIYGNEGFYPATMVGWPNMSAEGFVGTPMEQDYAEKAADPAHWPVFVDKMKHLLMNFPGWPASDIILDHTDLLLPIVTRFLDTPEQ